MVHPRSLGAVIFSFTLLLAACGDDKDDETGGRSTERTTTTERSTTTEATTTTTAPTQDTTGMPITVGTADISIGTVLVDVDGKTLYGFKNDTAGTPTCAGGCAGAWPALLVEGQPVLGPGVEASVITTVAGAEGGTQVKAGPWPLYRFSGDAAAGDANGQGLGGVWFAVGPDGSLLEQPS